MQYRVDPEKRYRWGVIVYTEKNVENTWMKASQTKAELWQVCTVILAMQLPAALQIYDSTKYKHIKMALAF